MDKKPFRVTNEQANAVIACSDGGMECPSTCPNYGIDDCPIGNVADYMLAADLLDARELIKEMLEEISIVVSTASSETTKSELSYISNYTEMRDLLKKTKDYL